MPKYKARPKILIVEDEASTREALHELLKDAYRLHSTPNVEEALPLLGRHIHSAVLVDLGLPGARGETLLDEVRKLRLGTPVIVLTADRDISSALACISKGAYDYLTKPFKNEELLGVLGRAVELFELRKKEKVLAAWQGQAPDTLPTRTGENWKGLEEEAQALVTGFLKHEQLEGKRFATLVKAVERELVLKALSLHHWNQVHAAKWLGINVITLAKRMAEHSIVGIKRPAGLVTVKS